MMKICITGATGMIGSSLVRWLSGKREFTLTALTRTSPAAAPDEQQPPLRDVRWIRGDLGSTDDCARVVDGQDVIIHLAHTNSPLTSDQDMAGDTLLNLVPTLNLLKAVQSTGCRPHLIYPSSGGAVYGVSHSSRPFSERDPCTPPNSYGIQKLAAEHYIRLYAERGHLSASVLRIGNAYGWLLSPERQQGLIGIALFQLLKGQPIRIVGNPNNVRDYIHIDDIRSAIGQCLRRRNGFEIFNIGTGTGTSVTEVIALIERLAGAFPGRVTDSRDSGRFLPGWCVLDIGKAARELGWSPKITLEAGIRLLLTQTARSLARETPHP